MQPKTLKKTIDAIVEKANKVGGISERYAQKMEKQARKAIILAVYQNIGKDGKISNTDAEYIVDLVRNSYKQVFTPTAAQSLVTALKIGINTVAINTIDAIATYNGIEILESRLNKFQKAFLANVQQTILETFNNPDGQLQQRISSVLIQAAQTGLTRDQILLNVNTAFGNDIQNITKLEVHEAYYGYQRATAEAVADAYDLKWWSYIGTIKAGVKKKGSKKVTGGSRPFCVHVINNMKSVFSDADKQPLINQFTGTRGYKKDTTVSNFIVNCGGWNCRHIALPITYKKAKQLNPNI